MRTLYLVSVWVHILAAMLWAGGMAFLVLVMVPLLRRPESRERAAAFIHTSGLRFRAVGWACFGTLIVTGTFNMAFRGMRWSDFFDGMLRESPMTRALGLKLLAVAAVLALSAVHDFWIGPTATALWQERPDSPEALLFRRRAAMLGRINALLALVIVFLAVALVRGGLG